MNKMGISALLLLASAGCAPAVESADAPAETPAQAVKMRDKKTPPAVTLAETIDIAPVWSGHPVEFALLTQGDQQFVAFYDAQRNMTIAQRTLGDRAFRLTVLPTKVGWDSHNGIEMAVDDDGYIHVSGNMHAKPLIYFRSTRPLDASTLARVPAMTGEQENSATYPHFFRGPKGEFLFTYRDGHSGEGNQITNVYDLKTQTWSRLVDEPLFDGEGERNAYPTVPELGPDGFFHVVWVWRDTTSAETSHDPSYARSRDLVHWENSRGRAAAIAHHLCDRRNRASGSGQGRHHQQRRETGI